jgi:hypothetical protein
MRSLEYICFLTLLVMVLACAAGCTTTQSTASGPATPAPTTVAGAPGGYNPPPVQATSDTPAVKSAGIDTTINIHYNDYDCLDVVKELGVVYLNPDQKYTIQVSPGNSPVNVNVLLLDVSDKEKIQNVRPEWNAIAKSWDYEGLVPLVQFKDVSSTQVKTVTIKNQGKYFLCADDRKESGTNDVIIRVPIKITRV